MSHLKLNLILNLKIKNFPLHLSTVYHDADYNKYYNDYNMHNIMTGIAQLNALSCANKKLEMWFDH